MSKKIFEDITRHASNGKKMLAVLIDPEKVSGARQEILIENICSLPPDIILVGGSLVSCSTEAFVRHLKETVSVPVVLFPGGNSQFTPEADALLYLSLISGRNPEYLIGQHVQSAISIKRSGIEVIPTSYILIDGGCVTSVQYVSNTMPIPSNKTELAVATAVAGELLGHKLIYLEAGSGALYPVPEEMIRAVKNNVSLSLIVGGGLRSAESVKNAYSAGADIAVVGTILESNPDIYFSMVAARDEASFI